MTSNHLLKALRDFDAIASVGRVARVVGTTVRVRIPDAAVGDRCEIALRGGTNISAEVVGLDERRGAILMPLGPLDGLRLDDEVRCEEQAGSAPCGDRVRGRVLNALGDPIDGRGPLPPGESAPIFAPPPWAMGRRRISAIVPTGIRAIDALLTVGRGQRLGIFAPAGGGKSTLLASLARNIEADSVVLALIGERGREVAPFIEDNLRSDGLSRATVVVSTSDEPALLRLRAAHVATAIASAERRMGRRVVLLMDSVTRFARALREVGLAAGELPARRGFPPSVFASLPQLFERAGNDEFGSITAFYAVLVEGELDDDPIAEETRSLLDGHLVLSDALARRGHYPAIDVLASKSRLMNEIAPRDHLAAADRMRRHLAVFDSNRGKIDLGLYESGANPEIDAAVAIHPQLEAFLRQSVDESSPLEQTILQLQRLTATR